MRIIRGLPLPDIPTRFTFDFDRMQHGDAIEVPSVVSAKETFRRWRKVDAEGRDNFRLISDPDNSSRLFFVDLNLMIDEV